MSNIYKIKKYLSINYTSYKNCYCDEIILGEYNIELPKSDEYNDKYILDEIKYLYKEIKIYDDDYKDGWINDKYKKNYQQYINGVDKNIITSILLDYDFCEL